ncbi:MAG TPA: vWA domain-containing protein [Thermoanaerobaculia bacterium]|nr:vWA domain-containing protein [Thermoanaerobaculia bacterium]
MSQAGCWLTLLVAVALTAGPPAAAQRHVAVILDTSGSMGGSDPPRYTMQLSQILADLLDDADELTLIRMPNAIWESCSAAASSALALRLDSGDRSGFKRRLDGFVQYEGGTHFAAPIHTAISVLPRQPGTQRLLLIIADAGGLGGCSDHLSRELLELRASGATIAAINLGGTAGAFDQNPAFDFTTAALDAPGLIAAVAKVYQRFLGSKKVQVGAVGNSIEVDIAPFVGEAFLVVAADGPLPRLTSAAGNPAAAGMDLDYRGGGQTTGFDQQVRGYRVARLERPATGRWTFGVPGLDAGASWMLLQDSAIGLRSISARQMARGVETPIELELFDQLTGRRITDTSRLPGLSVTLDVDGNKVALRDDGHGADRRAGDGVFSTTIALAQSGERTLAARIESELLDRSMAIPIQVVDASWASVVRTPPTVEVSSPALLAVELQPVGAASSLRAPQRVDVATGADIVALHDDGRDGDRAAGDRIYSRHWAPPRVGSLRLDYTPVGGNLAPTTSAPLEVVGRLAFGRPIPVRLGRAHQGKEVAERLSLGNVEVKGNFEARVSTPFQLARSALEIDSGAGWVPLGSAPTVLQLAESGRRSWPIRLRVGGCPPAWPPQRASTIVVEATTASGRVARTVIPLTLEVVPEPWLRCWWPLLAAALALLLGAVLIHGFWSPSRFAPRLGVMLSPEEDINEGFLHPIRAQRSSRSGFYRDARIYVAHDYRLSGKPAGAIARLRADAKLVRIQPAGAPVWRRDAEGRWEPIAAGETTVRFGDLYRNDLGNLFFEIRNE